MKWLYVWNDCAVKNYKGIKCGVDIFVQFLNFLKTHFHTPQNRNTVYSIKRTYLAPKNPPKKQKTPQPLHLHTASSDITQMSLNTPKVMGDYLYNSHLPISELQVYSVGTGMGTHSCVYSHRATTCEDLFWMFKVVEVFFFISLSLSLSFFLQTR